MTVRFDPDQPRDPNGKWTSGGASMPSVLSGNDFSLGGKSGRLEAKPGGKVGFQLGGGSAELDRQTGAVPLAEALDRRMQGATINGADGQPAVRVRFGEWEDDVGADAEIEFVGQGKTVKLTSAEASDLAEELEVAAASQRLELPNGPTDLYLQQDGSRIGIRTQVGGLDAVALEFDRRSWDRLRDAENVVDEGFDEHGSFGDVGEDVDSLTVKTNEGPILIERVGTGMNANIRFSAVNRDDWYFEREGGYGDGQWAEATAFIEEQTARGSKFGRAKKGVVAVRTGPVRMHRATGYVERSGLTDDSPLRVVMASEGRQADGIDLRMSGAQLERYRGNPVLGYGHSYHGRENLPIGRVKPDSLRVQGKHISGDLEFDPGDPFAREVERKLRAGYLNAVSIGFEVTEWENGQGDYYRGGVATGWTLTELSVVPVPMDASALVTSGRGGPGEDDDLMPAVLRFLAGELKRRGVIPLPHLGDAFRPPTNNDPEPPAQVVDPDAARSLLAAFAPKEIG